MELKYIGTNELKINNYGVINQNDIIKDEEICNSLKGRDDFVNVKAESKTEKPRRIIKSRRYKRR